MAITEAEYEGDNIPNEYSEELKIIIKSMLNKDKKKRPMSEYLFDRLIITKYLSIVIVILESLEADKYYGQVLEGNKNGVGVYYRINGDKYDGKWRNNLPNGKGKMFYGNGDEYDGQWFTGEKTGKGTLIQSNGYKYIGDWVKGKKEGKGVLVYI